MARFPILVITETSGFGGLIRQTLEQSGRYTVTLAETIPAALQAAENEQPRLVIFDCDFQEAPAADFIQALRTACPALRLVIVPPENNLAHPLLRSLRFDGYLSKPFYLPDLTVTVDEALGLPASGQLALEARPAPAENRWAPEFPPAGGPPARTRGGGPAPAWLSDVNRAAQHLMRLSLESAAQASLIVRGEQLWAYAGELPQPAAEELARALAHHRARGGGSDLARFIHLAATGGEHMLYATDLGGEFMLALVFDAETPFSRIRNQASALARNLATPPPIDEDPPAPARPQAAPEPDRPPAPPPPAPPAPESPAWTQPKAAFDLPPDLPGLLPDLDEEDEAADAPPAELRLQAAPQPFPAAALAEGQEPLDLEPVSAAYYSLFYTCILIPRLPRHTLTGSLAQHLSEWITQLCLAFGWRLEHLAIRPHYVQWIVNMPPATSPSYVMRTLRTHTSKRIFTEFARLREENPSGDFWAPGYLIMGGRRPAPEQLIREFITQTRNRQGAPGAG
jgi:REP element-mobilizing transposase RayT/ActR/RegA family two-component response regulator